MRNTLGALTHTHGFDLNDYIDIVARHPTEYFVDLRYIILDQPTGNKFISPQTINHCHADHSTDQTKTMHQRLVPF